MVNGVSASKLYSVPNFGEGPVGGEAYALPGVPVLSTGDALAQASVKIEATIKNLAFTFSVDLLKPRLKAYPGFVTKQLTLFYSRCRLSTKRRVGLICKLHDSWPKRFDDECSSAK